MLPERYREIIQVLSLCVSFALADTLSNHVVYRCPGSALQARQLARDHNLIYVSEVFPGSHMHHAILPQNDPDEAAGQERQSRVYQYWNSINSDPRVSWVQRQVYQPRELRYLTHQRDKAFFPVTENEDLGPKIDEIVTAEKLGFYFNDPYFPKQWYLHGQGESEYHLDVIPVWKQGYSGRGVRISVLDDTVSANNPDIEPNFDPHISGDLGEFSENDGQETKKNPLHGTYCASVIAAVANNSICGVGVAFNAKVGGVKLLMKKRVLDIQEANALNFKLKDVDIYSASWGPPDDGRHIGGPGILATEALIRGVTQGRKGLGVIYVWASGNGGTKGDNCGFDNYASSIYTLTVSALTPQGLNPFYAEHCPAALTSVYVGGNHVFPRTSQDLARSFRNVQVVAAEGDSSCTTTFQGTSAAAPLAAGIIALLLEANPRLTWRDVQHLVVRSSFPPNREPGWQRNAAGLFTHPMYGFGALNATDLVIRSLNWKNVPEQKSEAFQCSETAKPRILAPNKPVLFYIPVEGNPVESLEYVKATFTAQIHPRGVLDVALKSPSGVVSRLLLPRPADNTTEPFLDWSTASSQFWGENPAGNWALIFTNTGIEDGHVVSCSLNLYGF